MNDLSCKWRLENNTFYYHSSEGWIKVYAEDVYCSAFGASPSAYSQLPVDCESVKEAFPNIRFSKFSVAPFIRLELKDEKIIISILFAKKAKEVEIPFPSIDSVNYGFIDSTWCYFSGEYDQILDILASAEVTSSEISFHQYIEILNKSSYFVNIKIEDFVNENLSESLSSDSDYQPIELKANLYPYQKTGFRWLKYITDDDCGCILGDEMGLGKTLQVISLFEDRKNKMKAPCLVVAPLSLLENWRREIARFAPNLNVHIHHGSKRTGRYKDLLNYDVVITSYGATVTDLSLFEMIRWDILVLDEAQNIKNPYAARTTSIKQIPHRSSIAVTGTPFENHMSDIWSILDFSVPGCLGTLQEFNAQYSDDILGAEKIEPILTALMIRRKVEDVAKDLPEKVIIPQALVMDLAEALRYEDERQELLTSSGGRSATLATLTKLRMYCTHPLLVEKDNNVKDPAKISTKYTRFCEIVEEIVEQDEKVIVFSSYTEMFEIFKNDIPYRFNIPVDCINGSTPADERQKIVDVFSDRNGSAMLVLNPRAAGVGLNITAANHVIHYNLEWNPSLEDQATARAFRRGQEKTVFVYRLYYKDTVEEIVNLKIDSKRSMSETAVIGSEGNEDTKALLLQALGMSPLREE